MSWQRPNIGSRMNREVHVRFWERAGVKFLRATRHNRRSPSTAHCPLSPAADMRQRQPWAAMCPQEQTDALHQISPSSFEQCVGSNQKSLWNREAHCLGSLHVDGQLEFRRLLDW